jgi:hypothetical protein
VATISHGHRCAAQRRRRDQTRSNALYIVSNDGEKMDSENQEKFTEYRTPIYEILCKVNKGERREITA